MGITLVLLYFSRVVERKAISTQIGRHMVVTAPAPTSGPKLLAFLNAMELKKDRKTASQGRFGGGGDRSSGAVSAAGVQFSKRFPNTLVGYCTCEGNVVRHKC